MGNEWDGIGIEVDVACCSAMNGVVVDGALGASSVTMYTRKKSILLPVTQHTHKLRIPCLASKI